MTTLPVEGCVTFVTCVVIIFIILLLKLNVRGKNKKEKLGGLFKGLAKGVDEVLISGQKVNLELTYV